MPWLQVYDNDKYGRWLVEFSLEISCLQEERPSICVMVYDGQTIFLPTTGSLD